MDGKKQKEHLSNTYKAITKLWDLMKEGLSKPDIDWPKIVNGFKGNTDFESRLIAAGIAELERIRKECLNE